MRYEEGEGGYGTVPRLHESPLGGELEDTTITVPGVDRIHKLALITWLVTIQWLSNIKVSSENRPNLEKTPTLRKWTIWA